MAVPEFVPNKRKWLRRGDCRGSAQCELFGHALFNIWIIFKNSHVMQYFFSHFTACSIEIRCFYAIAISEVAFRSKTPQRATKENCKIDLSLHFVTDKWHVQLSLFHMHCGWIAPWGILDIVGCYTLYLHCSSFKETVLLSKKLIVLTESLKDDVSLSAGGFDVDSRSTVLNETSEHLDNGLYLLIYAFIPFNVWNVL